jgi:hypothetical protein
VPRSLCRPADTRCARATEGAGPDWRCAAAASRGWRTLSRAGSRP